MNKMQQGEYRIIDVDDKFSVIIKREDVGYVIDIIDLTANLLESVTVWDDDITLEEENE